MTASPSVAAVAAQTSEESDAARKARIMHDKASYMLDHGFNYGTDEDLARVYDRAHAIDRAKEQRDQRLQDEH